MIVLDFETTGLSPNQGDRAIEIGAVRIDDGVVTGEFQALMNPGQRISEFIEGYTGITNAMLATASPCDEVMRRFSEFICGSNLIAHNASFDQRFLDAEFDHISTNYTGTFSCSLLLARRIYPNASNHKLATLISYKSIPADGAYHRALYDAQMTAKLWLAMLDDIRKYARIDSVPFSLVQRLCKTPKKSVLDFLHSWGAKHGS